MTAPDYTTRGTPGRLWAKILLPLSVAVLTVLMTRVPLLNLGVVERLELASLDFRFQSRGPLSMDDDSTHVVIVEISQESFESLPDKWPWPRSYYAHLIKNLSRAGAKVVGIDILFVGGDMYSPVNDEDLRTAIRETGNVVLAGKTEVAKDFYRIRRGGETYGNVFYDVDSSLGLVNIRKDADDVVRQYYPFFSVDTALNIPTFGFAVLNKYYGLPHSVTAENQPDVFVYRSKELPKYDYSSLLINYFGPSGSFRHIKFVDVLDDETFVTLEEARTGESTNTFSDPDFGYLYDGTFKNKIVLVGSTMPEDQDLHAVAIAQGRQAGDNKMYGVEIHANLIESVLLNQSLTRQSALAEILLVTALSFVTFLITSSIKGAKTRHHALVELNGFLFTVAELFIIGFLGLRLFIDYGYVISLISPILAIIGGYFASTAYHFVVERKQRMMIKMMFSTYVSPSVVDELIMHPEKLKLGGERKELSVLFSDLEGFTTLAETIPPEELVGLLNEYLSTMTSVVLRNIGTIDKFEGDLIMAFWGAPIPQQNHVSLACTAALQMQSSLAAIRSQWTAGNKPALFARIGINTGDMIVGNMGSTAKFNYTVIGDSVNIASRLEGANKIYKTEIIISEQSYCHVKDEFLCRELDILTVKGRTEPIRIYELIDRLNSERTVAREKLLSSYNEALRLYKDRRWTEARKKFEATLELNPADYPSQLYVSRTHYFELNPPDPSWDGVFTPLTP